MSAARHRWLRLVLGLAAVALFVGLLHVGSVHLGGAAGRLIENNLERDLEASALFYSEVTGLEDFLDDRTGAYGRNAVVEAVSGEVAATSGPVGEGPRRPAPSGSHPGSRASGSPRPPPEPSSDGAGRADDDRRR